MGLRVMVVDDQATIRRLVRSLFESAGFEVCEAGNGAEAIQKAEQSNMDLILLDLSMPVMNGLQAARVLRQKMPAVPLLMFTNFEECVVRREAQAAGISAVVSKSHFADQLLDRAVSLLN